MLTKYLRTIPLYEHYFQRKLAQQSEFYRQNRITVLLSYRFLLKSVSRVYPRVLQQTSKVHVSQPKTQQIRYLFKQSKYLANRYETEARTNLAVDVVEHIKKGDHSVLGDFFTSNRNDNFVQLLPSELKKRVRNRHRWWGGFL